MASENYAVRINHNENSKSMTKINKVFIKNEERIEAFVVKYYRID